MSSQLEFEALLDALTCETALARAVDDAAPARPGAVRCLACAHGCAIAEGARGICRVRFNQGGRLRVPHGYVAGLACDPIEKKPFFHFLPGRDALSFGMLGCNLHCPFCQNWSSSQALRDPAALVAPRRCSAAHIVELAKRAGAPAIASTYNEPLITAEWAVEVFRLARAEGLATCFVSNGHASRDVLDYLDPWLDAMNVDLKCFTDEGYRTLGGRLEPVLETIRGLWERGKWVEVVTLLVPGFNDDEDEVRRLADFVASVSPDIPWHVTAYHADYRQLEGPRATPQAALRRAIALGRAAGIRYVYAGNVRGLTDEENTRCHVCGRLAVERAGFTVRRVELDADGRCAGCGARLPGVWRSPHD